jgi:hypothetical protein
VTPDRRLLLAVAVALLMVVPPLVGWGQLVAPARAAPDPFAGLGLALLAAGVGAGTLAGWGTPGLPRVFVAIAVVWLGLRAANLGLGGGAGDVPGDASGLLRFVRVACCFLEAGAISAVTLWVIRRASRPWWMAAGAAVVAILLAQAAWLVLELAEAVSGSRRASDRLEAAWHEDHVLLVISGVDAAASVTLGLVSLGCLWVGRRDRLPS